MSMQSIFLVLFGKFIKCYANLCYFHPIQWSYCNINALFVAPMSMSLSLGGHNIIRFKSDVTQVSASKRWKSLKKSKFNIFSIFTPVFLLWLPTVTYISETDAIFRQPMPRTNISVKMRSQGFLVL